MCTNGCAGFLYGHNFATPTGFIGASVYTARICVSIWGYGVVLMRVCIYVSAFLCMYTFIRLITAEIGHWVHSTNRYRKILVCNERHRLKSY